jgi:GntR family transcriptional regulator of vanillate catabolism
VRRPIRTLDVTTAPFASIGLNFATEQPSEAKAVIERSLAAGDRLLERGSFEAGDLTIYRGINGDFHDTVLAASRNRMLGEMIRTCHRVPVSSSRNIVAFEHRDVRRRHDDHHRINDDHHRIYEAIIAGEPWRAEWLMREHVSSVKGSLIRALAARNADQADQTDRPST